MATQTNKKLNLAAAVNFDDRTALHLTQAFNQETEVPNLLGLLFSQLQALCGAHGATFVNDNLDLEIRLGKEAAHHLEYNLEFAESQLGVLTIYYLRRQSEPDMQTAEDLIALTFTALRNAITLTQIRSSEISPPTVAARARQEELSREEKADTLLLMSLDGYHELKSASGHEWAQILMASVLSQIKEGLRGADGVYQISDELIAVLLPNTDLTQAERVGEKVRSLLSGLHLSGISANQELTACMGIADAKLAATAEDVMAHAKLALAYAQTEGQNNICAFSEDNAEHISAEIAGARTT